MDWNKAKNIFIAMFLIINIFLSYQLYTISRNQYIYIEQEEIESVKQYLVKKNIQIDTTISDRVLISPSINVKYHQFDIKKIDELFFNSVDYEISNTAQGFNMKNGDISVEVTNGIFINYQNHSVKIENKDVNEKKCIANAYSFINKLQLNTGNQFEKIKEVEKGYIRLVLGQQHSSVSVDSSQIEIIATEDGVIEANINWIESIKPNKRQNTITPVMALLKVYGNKEAKDEAVVVKQIRQCYYFSPNVQENLSDKQVIEGTLSPMWVIESDKANIYVNAYTENVENTILK